MPTKYNSLSSNPGSNRLATIFCKRCGPWSGGREARPRFGRSKGSLGGRINPDTHALRPLASRCRWSGEGLSVVVAFSRRLLQNCSGLAGTSSAGTTYCSSTREVRMAPPSASEPPFGIRPSPPPALRKKQRSTPCFASPRNETHVLGAGVTTSAGGGMSALRATAPLVAPRSGVQTNSRPPSMPGGTATYSTSTWCAK
eukprot:scaffold140758_cov26-Tisochrysis_lutea.AAC.1